MRTFTISRRYLPLLIVTACGDDARALPDTGSLPDPAADPGAPVLDPPEIARPRSLERLNWRNTRGAPIATGAVTIPAAEMFAVSGSGFVTRSECQNSPVCSFAWNDLAGTPGMRRDHMTRVTITSVSPDGGRALLVALDAPGALETCIDARGATPVARGALQLLDLATGTASFELPLRSNLWSAPGFTPRSDWFFAAPIEGTACIASTTGLLSATSPFARPPGLAANDQFVQMVDARRWLVIRDGTNLGLADPLAPDSFRFLGEDPSRFDATQGWAHVYLGFGNLAQDVVSISPTGVMRETTLRDEDWFAFGSLGRWVRVCGLLQPDGYRTCRVVDAQAEVAPVTYRATFASGHPDDDAVLLGSGAVVFVGPTDDGGRAVQRIVLATGRREILHRGDGALRPLGDGAAALLLQDGLAWLIEAEREELVAEYVSHVVSVPRLPPLGRVPGRQDDVALLVSSSGVGRFTLAILDVRTRRVATVTDSLYFTPPLGSPFAFDDGCGQPWTTRHGGGVIDGLFQQPQHLFFVEQGTPATLWLLPIDLSAPPRRLAELAGDPISCHAPLASPDGRRVGFAQNGADGTTTQITLSSE